MAISDTELGDKIMAAFMSYNQGGYLNEKKSPKHLKILGDTLKEYFEEKTEISYGWAAVNSDSSPDPATKFDSLVEFPAFDLTSAVNLITLAALIQAAVLGGIINHPSEFSVTPGSYKANSDLSFILQSKHGNDVFFKAIVKPLCAWYLTCINPAALPGKHGSYSGATTGMGIK
jgi:hypothetical protein